MTRVTFLLFDGFSNMVLSCLLEPLRAVRDQAGADIRWQVRTPTGGPVRASSGLLISPDPGADGAHPGSAEGSACDMLVVVAGYGYREHALGPGPAQVSAQARGARIVVGADTGAWLVAAAGLLRDQRATLHWSLLADFAERFPDITVVPERHVMQGRVWTCGGASSALDLMLGFIGQRFGPAQAFVASSMFVHDADRQPPGAQGQHPTLIGRGSARLRQVITLMAEQMEPPLPLPRLAARAGLSASALDRLFRTELSMAPGRYYQLLRLSHARDLAQDTALPLREIALRCGYGDAPALCKAFRRAHGHAIRQPRPAAPIAGRGRA